MTETLSGKWWELLGEELNADARWSEAAKWFEARIEFRHENGAASLDVRGGKVTGITDGPSARGADIIVSAPHAEWDRVVNGETDWYRGTSPGLGEITLGGDTVLAMRNIKVMWLLLEAMKRVGKDPAPRPEPSPAPRPSGKEITGRYIDVNGIRTYYEEAGEGPAIICFHAASQDSLMYRHVLEGLSDEYRVIAVDAPGHCKTLVPQGGPFESLTRHAEFNEALIDALGLQKPAIVGCSMAGNMVLELGARRPDGYSAIISSEGADYTPTVSEFFLDMLKVDGQQILECWSQSLTGDRTPPDRAEEVVWQIQRNTAKVAAADLTGYAGFDVRDQMHQVTAPVLLLAGDADWLVYPDQVNSTQSHIEGSEIAVLAGTGHYPMIENPYEYNEAVRSFLHKNDYK
ncbi:alpha/beta hydrolase [Pseudarthrobacter oxydans]|uniref:alpha/beta fold hydrolase n=1 Tax=Pseudarthrobacter oxydans TaxID=1671 RepID=UPI003ECF8674